ncbi:type VI secretion system lipoprotein TssJ [Phytopseudomonas dryadis]|uniref:Type VI secretion system lipoprotein TssJ n=1 Tax=Phytopseudomonas dryadis TaxID=2487520 RepID=A0ABY1Z0R5_9GAMM|nr:MULTISPECIES: type VI secretion system lipoprotein TssJ [Pseudomonas]TBV01102.1 type VI secretion system lipoprotein TssJ [Pseudomonas dryadis]TBV13812.1 type VI secretion system lipoprotein TssJ [Pseudomonas sp. FRB 230]
MPRILPLLVVLLLLGACASAPDKPVATTVRLQVQASPDLNPATGGGAAPVWIHLYQLRNASGFSRADFFSLVERADATLAGDLLEHDRFVLRPGESQVKSLTLDDATRQLGVVVAYRALDRSTWRQVIEIPAHQASTFRLRLDAYAVDVAPLITP